MSGVGKTSITRALAARRADLYRIRWLVDASTPDTAVNSFRELHEALAPGSAVRLLDPVLAVHRLLARRRDRWLLVLDDALPGYTTSFRRRATATSSSRPGSRPGPAWNRSWRCRRWAATTPCACSWRPVAAPIRRPPPPSLPPSTGCH